ncbi:DNA-binding response regulator [Salmonella enterica]|uniref:DNA-binding response regulator n=6 Tax=Salmonella enterica TaxID=28901 RepID=A0A5H6XXF4_SALET|nr:DNA-binding response regulator [Salmonella enterica]EAA3460409.1 DNA-binding response regulator [Salmonella enterica subsp. enterica serovar Miami]EAA4490670.1 DNA-binding response regulator [Salmonella enterica subsp. enterica]EAA6277664.1 DNA-binding response regulator [Salmonella enterica subsp. enterica serovar Telhashomer]EBM1012667.1 DNA-binding response regulator [Salmonella enterica subsp. enterica serovar Paratyphi B]EBQ5851704.1 DNA-binding response regulator [Salmonella enterica 
MHTEKKPEVLHYAVVYSPEWVKSTALKYLSGHSDAGNIFCVKVADGIDGIFSLLNENTPDVLILDIPVRDYVSLLCHIRRRYPALPVIITQSRILFSDRAVASWFGNIWLREYDSLMTGYPDTLISDCVTDPQFAGVNCSAACATGCQGGMSDIQILGCMERWLCALLTERMESGRCARMVTEWLSRGLSPREVGERLRCSEKLVYHYRWKVIRALGITGHPRDFIPSLSLKTGPVPEGYPVRCLMREAGSDTHA